MMVGFNGKQIEWCVGNIYVQKTSMQQPRKLRGSARERLNITSIGIPIWKMRRSYDRLIFNMAIPIHVV